MYAETCASIALCFFARAMMQLEPDGRYADALERALYNTCLAGMSLDGHNFFHVNPLEVDPEASKKDARKHHVLPVAAQVVRVCVLPAQPGAADDLAGQVHVHAGEGEIYVNLYMQNQAQLKLGDARVSMECLTD